jgi:hypothetical protein
MGFTHHPTHMARPIRHGYTTNHIRNGSHECCGIYQSLGFKGETNRWVSVVQSNQSEGRSDTKGGQYFGTPGAPSRGPGALKLLIGA